MTGRPFGSELPEDALSAYLDGELTADARAEVEARLAGSAEWRSILDEVRAARAALRALPVVDPPAGFFERLLAEAEPVDAGVEPAGVGVADIEQARARRSPRRARWVAALGGAAAAAVVAAVLVAPRADRVRPSVASLTDAHAVRSSTGEDSVSSLAAVGKVTGFRK
ncbi:MAG TPA: zf-HC2 domain-containing protein [Acidimicrobiia bacterium]|nr:zf-HC2 domain-containing protein [Acidimicrobiia bacterium]